MKRQSRIMLVTQQLKLVTQEMNPELKPVPMDQLSNDFIVIDNLHEFLPQEFSE